MTTSNKPRAAFSRIALTAVTAAALGALALGGCSGAKDADDDDKLQVAETNSTAALDAENSQADSGCDGVDPDSHGNGKDEGEAKDEGKGKGKGDDKDRGRDGHDDRGKGEHGDDDGDHGKGGDQGACGQHDDDDGSMCHDGDRHHGDHHHHFFKVLDRLDGTKDHQITIAALPPDLPAPLLAALHALDTNGDGVVTRDEAKAGAHGAPEPPPPPVIN